MIGRTLDRSQIPSRKRPHQALHDQNRNAPPVTFIKRDTSPCVGQLRSACPIRAGLAVTYVFRTRSNLLSSRDVMLNLSQAAGASRE
jgi:hypothetical protein